MGLGCLRVLCHVDQQLPQAPKERDAGGFVQRPAPSVVLEGDVQPIAPLQVVGQPVSCLCEPHVVQDGRAQLKGDRLRALTCLGDELLELSDFLIKPLPFERPAQQRELHAGKGQQLAQAVVQVDGQVPPLPVLRQQRFGSRSPRSSAGFPQLLGASLDSADQR